VSPLLPPALRRPLTGWKASVGKKLGFTTPLDEWFARWVTTEAQEHLLGSRARLPSYLRADSVRNLLSDVRDRALPRARQLLSLYVLECWLRGAVGAESPERDCA